MDTKKLLEALYKLFHNLASYKIWLMGATFYLVATEIITLTGWEWVGFVALMIGGRTAEYYSKRNGNGAK